MRCRKFTKLIGPFADGELGGAERDRLEDHLSSCPECESRLQAMIALTGSLSSLPPVEPTPRESYRLINRVRAEMDNPPAGRRSSVRVRVATVGLTVLVAAAITTTWAVLAGGETGTKVNVGSDQTSENWLTNSMTPQVAGESTVKLAAASSTRPSLAVSQANYSTAELKSFHNDLGARIDIFSSYWYPALASGINNAELSQNQVSLTKALAEQASQAGKNPEEVTKAVTAALDEAKSEVPLLPCYAEQAKVDGKDAWLISISGPEDYLLFPNQELPRAMYLAAQGGQISLRINQSLLNELASLVAPFYTSSVSKKEVSREAGSQTQGDMPDLPISTIESSLTPEQQLQFQDFLRQIAAQSNNLALIPSLEALDYDQLLMLIQGNWAGLAAEGVDLTKFLLPPKRLYAVDAATDAVIWSGTK